MQLEFVIGVTGHRDLLPQHTDRYQQQVEQFLSSIVTSHPGLTIRVLTGLAEGADSLVADSVLKLAGQYPNLALTAILPMTNEEYEKDFSAESLQKYRHYCEQIRANNWQIVALPDHQDRNQCYANLSHYLNSKSDLLLAMWNGNSEPEKGGTAYTVKLATDEFFQAECLQEVEGLPDSEADELLTNILDKDRSFIYWIPVERLKAQAPQLPDSPGFIENLESGVTKSSPAYEAHLRALNEFQQDVNDKGKFTNYPPCEMQSPDSDQQDNRLRDYFSTFDALANYWQTRVKTAYNKTVWLTLFISCTFLIYAKLTPSLVVLGTHLVLFIFAFIWFVYRKPNQLKEKYTLYRALSESLRVEYLYYNAGLLHPLGFGSVANSIHHPGNDKINLLRAIIRQSWITGCHTQSNTKIPLANALLSEQLNYFKRAKTKLHKSHERNERFVFITILLPFLALCSFFIPELYQYYKATHLWLTDVKTWLVFFCALLPILGAVIELHAHHNSVNELQNQYSRQIHTLQNAMAHLQHHRSTGTSPGFYRLVGKILSAEHQMWLKTTSEKQVTTAHGG